MKPLVLLAALFGAASSYAASAPQIDVYRDPNCGCCTSWIKHLEKNGFEVKDHLESDMSTLKTRLGVPPRLASCHTAVINGQFVEGHVPAADVLALKERPDLLGLAAPGMPAGSPGMEMGDRKDAYAVIGLDRQGQEHTVKQY